MNAAVPRQELKRETFTTSRLMDFFSAKELTAQVGHSERDWPSVAVKELVDNALDACEDHNISPVIQIGVGEDGITVTDNGPGIAASTVESILDFTVRVSSREAYVSPTRGAQGNALKTLVAMPFVLDGNTGTIQVEARGVKHTITCRVDRIQQKPAISHDRCDSLVKNGTFVKVCWGPDSSKSILQDAMPRILQMAISYTTLNPHLDLSLALFNETYQWGAINPQWVKWKANDPSSPHWYSVDHLKRLIAAYIAQGKERPVREFIAEFRGLSSTAKQKAVLEAVGVSRQTLGFFVTDGDLDHAKVQQLLKAMQEQSKPVQPKMLGIIGKESFKARFLELGCNEESFDYGVDKDETSGLPWVIETAFAWRPEHERLLITGVNFSPGIINPFRQLGPYGKGLDSVLESQRAGVEEPIVLALHVTRPRVNYSDRGKSAVVMEG